MANPLYGKWFASTYEGSMMGAGPEVLSVWPWIVAHTIAGEVEINPRRVAADIGMSIERVHEALNRLQSPDPESRNPELEGRRIQHLGAFSYRVVTHLKYRLIGKSEAMREYNREMQASRRAKLNQPQGQETGNIPSHPVASHLSMTVDPNARRARTRRATVSGSDPSDSDPKTDPPVSPPTGDTNRDWGLTPPPKAKAPRGLPKGGTTVASWRGPTKAHAAYCKRHCLDLAEQDGAFRRHHTEANTELPKGWGACFDKWLLDRTPPAEPTPERKPRGTIVPPPGWAPSDEHRRIAIEERVDLDRALAECLDWHLANAEPWHGQRGWDAGFRKWLRHPACKRTCALKDIPPPPEPKRMSPDELAELRRQGQARAPVRKAAVAATETAGEPA